MHRRMLPAALVCAVVIAALPSFAARDGLLAEWNFDEGQGTVAQDSSGNNRPARLEGATWVRQGNGFAVYLDGLDDTVDCGTVGAGGPISLELWVRPMRKANGEACLLGEGMQSYLLTYYNTEVACWYIGAGSNGIHSKLELDEWNHVAGTFDGTTMNLWINGRLAASCASKLATYPTQGTVRIGTQGRPDLPHFKGLVDRVRVYNRPLSGEEVVAHFKGEASEYGFDPAWFSRVKVTPYFYPHRNEALVEADYRRLLPLNGPGRLEVVLCPQTAPDQILQRQVVAPVSGMGLSDVVLSMRDLAPGGYLLRVTLQDNATQRPAEEIRFTYPLPLPPLPSPDERVAESPASVPPTPFEFRMRKGGGFEVIQNGVRYPFVTRVSWPNGDFNRLTVAEQSWRQGEKGWRVQLRQIGDDRWTAETAGSDFYSVLREVQVFPTHVSIKDTYTNTSGNDLGLLIYNETPLKPGQVAESRLSGFERRGRKLDLSYPDYGPSVFFADASAGVGIIPLDDVYVIQAATYVEEQAAGVGTERFALPPGKSYTLEWAVYPTPSKDYFDFINAFRVAEGRISTVRQRQGIIGRRSPPSREQVERLGMNIAIIPSISNALDDPLLHIEGIEFMDFPKEMAFLKQQAADCKMKFPGLRVVFHIAHSLYCTNRPDRFADSRVILSDGRQSTWGDGSDFGAERQAQGWRWWIFYPTPGNSFHEALMKSVDVMMDEMGMDGGFMDGFLAGYQGQWSYDTDLRWDGHSAEIHPVTKTITRKVNSVLLLSQPSLIAYARKIRDKGGVVLANNCVYTRSLCTEKYIVFNNECASGPELHLAPNVMALASAWGPVLRSERDAYLDMLDKLRWGELWFSYGEPWERFPDKTSPTLAARQFPITFEEIRPGLVRGPERIVTMNPGVYEWKGRRDLHGVHKFDARGGPVAHGAVTTVDARGVRTDLPLAAQESAVIEPLPVTLESAAPINVRVTHYDTDGMRLLLNGRGRAVLRVRSGAFPVRAGMAFRTTTSGSTSLSTAEEALLEIPLTLDGSSELALEPAPQTP